MAGTSKTFISEATTDDLLRSVIEEIYKRGGRVKASKGWNTEIVGVLLELTNPRARLSRTESRGKLYSCLGQLCWYLAKSNELSFISYYLKDYDQFADGDLIFGGYGPRLFNWGGLNQIGNVVNLLKDRSTTRQAVVQLYDANDIVAKRNEVPCTCTLQFLLRQDQLHMFTCMRSNDVIWGLTHDLFSFTMLQEIIARELGVEIGTYKHAVGSLHLYDNTNDDAKIFLEEGYQSKDAMAPMPIGNPWPQIRCILEAELAIRSGRGFDKIQLESIDPYWSDLIKLLQIFQARRVNDAAKINEISKTMAFKIYVPFVHKTLKELESSKGFK